MIELELLCPAKNLEQGKIAVNYGADAVYIGAGEFGARAAAGNEIDEISELINYAHKFYARVYVTINTIIYEEELDAVQKLIYKLYEIGADAIIIQDMGILEFNLPPIPIHASTQTNNYDIDKIEFLENIGFQRVILARELSIKQIKRISKNTDVELEAFVHGALCVSLSGQCYFSHATTGRSANRGECSQNCRMEYSLVDSDNRTFAKDKYLLSMKDLNLSESIPSLAMSGITSFKIEGRLKDVSYVKNIVSLYRKKIDDFIYENTNDYKRSSSGKTVLTFTPDADKTFNRGFTDYFANGRHVDIANFNTPKSVGKHIGHIKRSNDYSHFVKSYEDLANGDGLCYYDSKNKLKGFRVNKVENDKVFTVEKLNLKSGTKLYRNNDHDFSLKLSKNSEKRKIDVIFNIEHIGSDLKFSIEDEDGNIAFIILDEKFDIAAKVDVAEQNIKKQLSKLGNTDFISEGVFVNIDIPLFIPSSKLNEVRRSLIDKLEKLRTDNYPRQIIEFKKNSTPFTADVLDYSANVINSKSAEFYKRHGVDKIEDGFELQNSFDGKTLMTTKHCLKFEFGICKTFQKKSEEKQKYVEPLYLTDHKQKYLLEFDCEKCFMKIIQD